MAGKWVLSFDGDNDYVNCGNDNSLDVVSGITIETLINPRIPQHSGVVSKSGQVTRSYFLGITNQFGGFRFDGIIFKSAGGYIRIGFDDSGAETWLATDSWNHVSITYDGTVLIGYVDLIEKKRKEESGTIIVSSRELWIGDLDDYDLFFDGSVAYVRVWNDVDISRLQKYAYRQINGTMAGLKLNLRMNEGSGNPQDASGFGNHGINYGATWEKVYDCPIITARPASMGRGLAGSGQMLRGLAR